MLIYENCRICLFLAHFQHEVHLFGQFLLFHRMVLLQKTNIDFRRREQLLISKNYVLFQIKMHCQDGWGVRR